MGDRGNIFFVDRPLSDDEWAGIYMYAHWAGSYLPQMLQSALDRGRGRWGDSQYLARIVFCEIVQDDVLSETGYGLSTFMGDNEHDVIRVNDLEGTVEFCEPGSETSRSAAPLKSYTYEQFLALQFE